MIIGRPEILRKDGEAECRAAVEWSKGAGVLWYRVPAEHGDWLSELSDAALVALLIPAMDAGEDIRLDGAVSARLLYALNGCYQAVLRGLMPFLRPVAIRAEATHSDSPRAPGVATAFSGGIDSFCVLADHHYARPPEGFRITHLLFSRTGAFGEAGDRVMWERCERLRGHAERMGLPLVRVNSNVAEFYRPGLGNLLTHTQRNVSVGHALQGGIGRFLYAAGFSYADLRLDPTYTMAHADAVTLPLLSTDRLDTISAGGEYTRVEKTLKVAGIPDTWTSLNVCAGLASAGNCSTCWKCLRTLLTLDIGGVLDRYAAVFDLAAYRRRRNSFIGKVWSSRESLHREIVGLARQRNWRRPLSSRFYRWLWLPLNRLNELALRRGPDLPAWLKAARRLDKALSRPSS
ncbi:MAG TPA: hypothetical protein P5567_10245 [Kiritimatiellia bacterium]|nr:hypothetical protein [Kiritimatiellia bacterium]HRZ12818.1 hypothetical protein [Kiritimatiellia bacterium]HSA18230.1 hypothetical protein [Kiritimatiellia bacterium]